MSESKNYLANRNIQNIITSKKYQKIFKTSRLSSPRATCGCGPRPKIRDDENEKKSKKIKKISIFDKKNPGKQKNIEKIQRKKNEKKY